MRYKCYTGTIDPTWTINTLKEEGVAMDDLQSYVSCEYGDLAPPSPTSTGATMATPLARRSRRRLARTVDVGSWTM